MSANSQLNSQPNSQPNSQLNSLSTSMDASILSSQVAHVFPTGVLSDEQLTTTYQRMLLIRQVEEALLDLTAKKLIGGAMHTAIGHEANALGTALALHADDYLTCTYRGHHHSLARGMDINRSMAEVLGRADGFAKGKGGSMHFIDPTLGLMGANGIVGAQVPQATGMALASKMRGDGRIAITFFGDGAIYQGVMHESFNMAQRWLLPVIFYCENNRYSEMTPISRTSSAQELYKFVHGYGMNSLQIDGNDVEQVYQAVSQAAERARQGEGPTFIEGITYRLAGHMAGDLETYRNKEELSNQSKHEPVIVLRDNLLQRGVSEETIDDIHSRVEDEVKAAVAFAQNSPWPAQAEAYTDVYKN
jgi:acetoin:2,6-dichlorophenolindophenol oxidoreductase subunit alpha